MAILDIAGKKLTVKDYCCIESGDLFCPLPNKEYLLKPKPLLWLYVNVTDSCNAGCPFCVNNAIHGIGKTVDIDVFQSMLEMVAPYIYGISFTGGEPMLHPELLDELIYRASLIVSDDLEIDIATNGTNLQQLANLKNIDRVTSIHISRHSFDDNINTFLMRKVGPGKEELRSFLFALKDPGKVVFNCVLQKGGVANCEDVAEFLDFAIDIGVHNSSFITMFKANRYCEEHYLSALNFPFVTDQGYTDWNNSHHNSQFTVWNRHSDHEYCHCLSGSYENQFGRTRFYFRCPGTVPGPDYCRQLVYTADNQMQDGFGSDRTVIFKS